MTGHELVLTVTPIGVVVSPLKKIEDCPLQESEGAPEAGLVISPNFTDCLDGLKVGDRLIVLTWLHLADRTVQKCRRRQETDTPLVGVFTTRSPDRPNPIGIHHVTVLSIERNLLQVAPLEVLEGTVVLDLKPDLK
jgi:tRNA-Thr(GGU) m(6)t(6)A37 methyltransferase TsaA